MFLSFFKSSIFVFIYFWFVYVIDKFSSVWGQCNCVVCIMQDFYSILGVSKNANKSEIKSGMFNQFFAIKIHLNINQFHHKCRSMALIFCINTERWHATITWFTLFAYTSVKLLWLSTHFSFCTFFCKCHVMRSGFANNGFRYLNFPAKIGYWKQRFIIYMYQDTITNSLDPCISLIYYNEILVTNASFYKIDIEIYHV